MTVKVKYYGTVISVVSCLVITLFFGLGYGAHVCYQEQYQLFEWTWKYFADTVMIPGGFADWAGRFITQFFFSKWAGAILIGLMLTVVQVLCWCSAGRKSPVIYVCSFIPSLLLLLYFLDSTALAGALVAVIIVLVCVCAVRSMNPFEGRSVLALVLVPILYFFAGPVSVIFVLTLPKGESIPTRIAAIILLALMPFVIVPLCHYPLKSLFIGIHYCRVPQNFPIFLWCSIGTIVIYIALIAREVEADAHNNTFVPASIFYLVMATGTALVVGKCADKDFEEMMAYDRMVYLQDWDGIIEKASMNMPDKPLSVSALNLALAKKDLLGDWQFSYYQSGETGLFPNYSISYFSLLPTSEIFWHLGMVGASQQYVFESQEAISDFQKSARCYKRLAETYIVKNDYDVARKYLRSLCNTLHYRGWAHKVLEMLEDEDAVDSEYGAVRSSVARDPDVLFNESNKAAMLKILLEYNPDNELARDYLVSLMLLEKDFDGAESQILGSGLTTLPKYWQEALLMQCATQGRGLDTLPAFVEESNISRFKEFIGAMRSNRNEVYMKKHFGNTYWYYCIYE